MQRYPDEHQAELELIQSNGDRSADHRDAVDVAEASEVSEIIAVDEDGDEEVIDFQTLKAQAFEHEPESLEEAIDQLKQAAGILTALEVGQMIRNGQVNQLKTQVLQLQAQVHELRRGKAGLAETAVIRERRHKAKQARKRNRGSK
jgi:hypothetical protein